MTWQKIILLIRDEGGAKMSILDKFSLENKKAVVIGASRGLGRRMALALAGAGADVVVSSRSLKALREVAKKITQFGRESYAFRCDVSNISEIEKLHQSVIEKFLKVDILINAIGTTIRKPSIEITEEDWEKVAGVNLKAMLFACKIFGKSMIEHGGGKIINIASLQSVIALPRRTLYNITKTGVLGLTRSLAIEWGKYKVNVNAIAPGYFLTEMTKPLFENKEWREKLLQGIPLGKVGAPEDLDGAVIFLSSQASDYVTGEVVFVDGGFMSGENL